MLKTEENSINFQNYFSFKVMPLHTPSTRMLGKEAVGAVFLQKRRTRKQSPE
jgi:hypothetical protein